MVTLAAGEDPGQPEDPANAELAQGILVWAARALHIFLSSNCARGVVSKAIDWWKRDTHVDEVFKNALPDSYKKMLGFLEAENGSSCYVYDRCPHCPLVYRTRFQEAEECPRCRASGRSSPRFVGEGRNTRPAATLIYNPLSEYIRYLWSQPDLAR